MLSEILLALAGVPSPIWDQVKNGDASGHVVNLNAYTSPAERTMLASLGELAELHVRVREAAANITRSHPSTVCRAVSSRISSRHLQDFTRKIIEVEQSILQEDAKYVGAYKIIPLSTIVTEFDPWIRPLRWLDDIVVRLQRKLTTGAAVMKICKDELHTGYTDVQNIAQDLLVTAEQAWLSSLLPWLMYGRLPTHAAPDFMIQHNARDGEAEYVLSPELAPFFISEEAANAVMEAGSSINNLLWRDSHGASDTFSREAARTLSFHNHQHINNLKTPIQSHAFEQTVIAINENISSTLLSRLLPSTMIFELLDLVQNFVLLKSGEFATCLIHATDKHLNAKGQQQNRTTAQPVRKVGMVEDLGINDADTAAILKRSLSELAALMLEHEAEVLLIDKVTTYLKLTTDPQYVSEVNTLLPKKTTLAIDLPMSSPLRMFLNAADISRYSNLSAYLISLYRAESRLNDLWQIPAHRRCYPCPIGPPRSGTKEGRQSLLTRRNRDQRRQKAMRGHWATASQVLFVLTEMRNYFHGEVISKSWYHLHKWLSGEDSSNPTSSQNTSHSATNSHQMPLPGLHSDRYSNPFISSTTPTHHRQDPRTLARAHRRYLANLHAALLLEQKNYLIVLNEILPLTDHFTALFHRTATTWTALDLQEDDGIIDAFSDFVKEEIEIMAELDRTNRTLQNLLKQLVQSIKEAEKQNSEVGLRTGMAHVGLSGREGEFVPWRAKTLDRLIMKLDFLTGDDGKIEDLVDGSEEEWHDA